MPRVIVVRAHVALDPAHHRQQLAREVGAHVGPQPGNLHICSTPRICCRLQSINFLSSAKDPLKMVVPLVRAKSACSPGVSICHSTLWS